MITRKFGQLSAGRFSKLLTLMVFSATAAVSENAVADDATGPGFTEAKTAEAIPFDAWLIAPNTTDTAPRASQLNLMQAVQLALKHSTSLALQRSQVALQMGVLQSAVGAFDPILTQDTSLSYVEEELTDQAKAALVTTRTQNQELIDDFNERLRNEQAVRQELGEVRADPTGASIENPDLRAQIGLLNRLEPALVEDFSLHIKPGQRVALVGGSGSGKSTVAKLITGLLEPWTGEILFDGISRTNLPGSLISNSLGVVDQDIFLFQGTVRENLTMWDSTALDVYVLQAARDAVIAEAVETRDGAYQSMVEEGGGNFSGGQSQRLEIARALISNPTMLVLDEATSALDTATERMIDDNLRRRGCTCITVAHRLSTIRDSDEIIVMERGKIVQRGTHDQLKAQPGLYQELIKE